jgi:hypothetical protein
MADRYWVGGSGIWDTTSTASWSATSGGAGGASVPTVADNVFFDQPAVYTVTMTGALACLDFTVSAGIVIFLDGTTPTINIRGSLTFDVIDTQWVTSCPITFSATTDRTITTSNAVIRGSITFNGVGGSWTLQDNLTLGTSLTTTLINGTLSLNTYVLNTGLFNSSGSGVRTINFGTGKIQLTSVTTSTVWTTAIVTNLTISGNPLVECIGAGTGVTKTITTGALSEENSISFSFLTPSGTSTYALGTSRFKDVLLNGVQTISNSAIIIYGNFLHLTEGGTTVLTAGTSAWTFDASSGEYNLEYILGFTYDFPWVVGTTTTGNATYNLTKNLILGASRSLTLRTSTFDLNSYTISCGSVIIAGGPILLNTGSSNISLTMPITHTSGIFSLLLDIVLSASTGYTFNSGSLNLNNFALSSPVFTATSGAGVRNLNFDTTSQLILTGSSTTIFNVTVANFNTSGNIYITSTYTGGAGTRTIVTTGLSEVQTQQGTGYNVSFDGTQGIILSSSATDTIALTGNFNSIDFTGFSGTLSNTIRTIYGDLILPTVGGTFTAGTNTTTLGTSTNQTITFNERTLDFPLAFINAGTKQLVDSLRLTSSRSVTFSNGTIDLNDNLMEIGIFISSGAGIRILDFKDSSELRLIGNNGTILNLTIATNLTLLGNVFINSTYTGAVGTRTFNSGLAFNQATGFDVYTSGSTGLVIGTTATDSIALIGNYNSIDLTGLTNTFLNSIRTIYGDLIIPLSGGTLDAGANATTFAGEGLQNLVSNGRIIDFPITIGNGTSNGTVLLGDSLTLNSTRLFTLNSGTFSLNDFTITTDFFSSTNTAVRSINFGNIGQFTLVGSNTTIVDMSTAAGFSYSGNQNIVSSYAANIGTRTFALGNAVGFDNSSTRLNFSTISGNGIIIAGGTDTISIVGEVMDLDLRNTLNIVTNTNRNVYGNFYTSDSGGTHSGGASVTTLLGSSGNFTVDTANRALNFPITVNGNGNFTIANNYLCGVNNISSIRAFTLLTGNVILDNVTVYTGSFETSSANVRSLTFNGSNSVIDLIRSGTTIWNSTNGSNFSWTGNLQINSSYTGNVGTRTFSFGNISEEYAFDVNVTPGTGFSIGTANDIVSLTGAIGSLDLTNFAATLTNAARTVHGNLVIPSTGGVLTAGTAITTLGSTIGLKTIDTSGRLLEFPLRFNGVGGNWILANSLVSNATTALTLANGVVDFNQQSLSVANLTIAAGVSGLKNLNTDRGIVHSAGNLFIVEGTVTSTTSGTYTMTGASSLTLEAPLVSGAFTLTAGNIILANANLICSNFTSNGTGFRSISFENDIELTGTGTVVNIGPTITNFTNTGNGNITVAHSGNTAITITPGGLVGENSINYRFNSGNYNLTITAGNVKSLDFIGYSGNLFNTAIRLFGNLTLSDTMTLASGTNAVTFANTSDQYITTNGKTLDFPITVLKTESALILADPANIGTTRTLTITSGNLDVNNELICGPVTHSNGILNLNSSIDAQAYVFNGGNIILNNNDLQVTTFTSNNAVARSITFNGRDINVTAASGTIVNMATSTNLIPITNGNINITKTGNLAATITPGNSLPANTLNYNILSGNYALTITAGNVKNLNFTGFSGSLVATDIKIHGNTTISPSMNLAASTTALTFAATEEQIITTNGVTIDRPVILSALNGQLTLNDAFNLGSARSFTLGNGTLNLNNFTLTTGSFSTAVGTKTILFNGGTITIVGSGTTAFNNLTPAGFNTVQGTAPGRISMTSSLAKTFVGNNATYNCGLDQAGAGNLTITGQNTFESLLFSYGNVGNANILLPANTNTSITTSVEKGTANNKLFGIFSVSAFRANLVFTSNTNANLNTDYISTKDIEFTTSRGSNPWKWYVGANSVNNGNVLGAIFQNNENHSAPILYFIANGSSFTVPADWGNANNAIHIWGAGGGSAGSKASAGGNRIGSSGGGGGGYTQVANFAAMPGSTVSYSIGAGGNGGTANGSNGANGGTTTFSTYSANGGGGSSTSITASTPGLGGIGETFNGGNGGIGRFSSVAGNNSAGGGGGGAGGPFGNGGIGGNASATNNLVASTSGGGGGGSGGGTAGLAGATATGGRGGNNFSGVGGGTAGQNGLLGGGGGGGSSGGVGGLGSFSNDILNSIGGGAGAGGAGANSAAVSPITFSFGGGAGGAGAEETPILRAGARGADGGIIILYTPELNNQASGSMFLVF